MKNITGKTPFFRLLIPVALGIIANEFIPVLPSAVVFASAGFILMLLSFFIPQNKEFHYRWVFGAGACAFIFSLITFQYKHKIDDSSLGPLTQYITYKGIVRDIPQQPTCSG